MNELWTQYERKRNALEEKWRGRVRSVLNNQLKRITDDYKRGIYQPDLHLDFAQLSGLLLDLYADVGGRFARATVRELRREVRTEANGVRGIREGVQGKNAGGVRSSMGTSGGGNTAGYSVKFVDGWRGLGFNEDWAKEVADELRLYGLDLAQKISNTTKRQIGEILAQAQERGWSTDETIKAILEQVTIENRVDTIVRTEVGRAANTGKMRGAVSMGVAMDKVWIGANDWRERPTHLAQNDKAVDLDGTFPNGLRYPGDPKGLAKEVCNCRCTVVFRVRKDPQGRVIRRNYLQGLSHNGIFGNS